MNKVLDLSAFKVETLDITMLDGTKLNINKPTQKIYIEILKLQNIAEEKDAEKQLEAIAELAATILSNNTNGFQYSKEDVEQTLPIELQYAVIQAYSEFIAEIQNRPN